MKPAIASQIKKPAGLAGARWKIIFGALLLSLAACSPTYPETCPAHTPLGLIDADEIAGDDRLPFRFPLAESAQDETLFFGWFGVSNACPPGMPDCNHDAQLQFHAAEDYKRPAGTPVYAMADGRISFSGTAGGYGWLIIIDHPQANLYSLYGHLSPSRWKLESGTTVKRGDLIAYLGDPDENGGSKEQPLEPHLHFGIRAGQTMDYPARGEWRYMAGWIRLCPQDLGWLQPSLVITNQEIPGGGYPQPKVGFWTRWGFELAVTGVYTLTGVSMLIFGVSKRHRFLLLFPGLLVVAAGLVLPIRGLLSSYALLAMGILILVVGVYTFLREFIPKPLHRA